MFYGLGPTVLAVCNHIVEIDDADNAHGSVYCLAQIDMGERFIDQSILYQDCYVRRDGRWLFEVRRHTLWFGSREPSIRSPGAGQLAGEPGGAGYAARRARRATGASRRAAGLTVDCFLPNGR